MQALLAVRRRMTTGVLPAVESFYQRGEAVRSRVRYAWRGQPTRSNPLIKLSRSRWQRCTPTRDLPFGQHGLVSSMNGSAPQGQGRRQALSGVLLARRYGESRFLEAAKLMTKKNRTGKVQRVCSYTAIAAHQCVVRAQAFFFGGWAKAFRCRVAKCAFTRPTHRVLPKVDIISTWHSCRGLIRIRIRIRATRLRKPSSMRVKRPGSARAFRANTCAPIRGSRSIHMPRHRHADDAWHLSISAFSIPLGSLGYRTSSAALHTHLQLMRITPNLAAVPKIDCQIQRQQVRKGKAKRFDVWKESHLISFFSLSAALSLGEQQ